MNAKVLRVLEYDKVIHMLEQKATSDPGRQLCRDLVPMTDLAQIEQAQTETADALTRIFQKGSLNFGSNKPLGMCLRSLEIGSTLSSEELLRIAGLLENTARVKNFGRSDKDEEQQDSLTEYFHCLEPLAPLSKEIRRCIIDVDEIADDASPALKKIRRSMVLTGEKIHNQLNSMVNGSVRNYLQDAVITTRDGRYCIPVKAEYKGQVPGMVHDQSSTGSTFFIEPAAVVSLNNQLRELEIEEQKEIAVILANLSAEAGAHTLEIAENQRIMTQLDFIFAKASLAMDQNASRPLFNDEHIVRIRQGRHPLLDRKKVVPIDVELGKNFDLLVITGPNTGGKTVCLKTVGLFTLMGQAGLHIPALDRSQLSVFTEVFADIGDEQSIEDDLSTYSSHLTNMKNMMKYCNEKSLILIDEFGGGTEPQIGGAIAEAVLKRFNAKKTFGVITTHYQNLKHFAEDHEGVVNGAMLYDRHEMRALFQLQIGNPGSSFAVEIARKIGLPEEVIADASEIVGSEYIQSDKYLQDIVRDKRYWETKRQNIRKREKVMEDTIARYERELEELEKSRKEILKKAKEDAEHLLEESNAKIENTIRTIKEAQAEKERTRMARQELTDFRQQVEAADKAALEEKITRKMEKLREKQERKKDKKNKQANQPAAQPVPKVVPIQAGDYVRIKGQTSVGQVMELNGKNAVVTFGLMKTNVKAERLERAEAPKQSLNTAKATFVSSETQERMYEKKLNFKQDIDVRGMRGDEALQAVTYFVDDAILVGMSRVRILHGTGTGILRTLIRQYLQTIPGVRHFADEHIQLGGAGITVVDLA